MIKINAPFCNQADFDNAVSVLKKCEVAKPAYGFELPFFAPGGLYGECWWSLDGALAVDGYKWVDSQCELNFLDNLHATQLDDGRVKLYGIDQFSDAHSPFIVVPIGSLPKFFATCYATAVRYNKPNITEKVFDLLNKNLNWWFTNRQDPETKLISALFEETFVPNIAFPVMEYCPPDTNIQIVIGCKAASNLAKILQKDDQAKAYAEKADEVLNAVHTYLWDGEKGAYYTYLLSKKAHYPHLLANSFTGIMFDDDAQRISRMCDLLTDHTLFGWNERPITTVAKNDELFGVVEGTYNGNPSWLGSVWTLTNKAAIDALMSVGQKELAAEFALKTVNEFRSNYTEFHQPFTGAGYGVIDYGWTASQFIQIMIEDIFGIHYNAFDKTITISPNLAKALTNACLSIEDIPLPDNTSLSVTVNNGSVSYRYTGDFSVTVQ